MSGAFYIAAVGLDAQQRALDTIANNISNVNTPTFKRSEVRFSEVLASQADPAALRSDLGGSLSTSSGVRSDVSTVLDGDGKIEASGRPFDLAISGAGLIEVMGPGGQTLLWRGGTLKVGEDGLLATAIEVGSDGVVRARVAESADPVEIGQIMLVRAEDPGALQRLDGGLYRADEAARLTEAQPGEDGTGLLVQGAIERSNVELTTEMVQMMLVQRAYAANAQVVQAADQLMAIANGLRR
jgi:flagellar basal-body rod protein FlgG